MCTAIQVLEDLNFYCVDNLPLSLLPKLAEQIQEQNETATEKQINKIAVGIDARNLITQLGSFSDKLDELQNQNLRFLAQ